MTQIMKVAVSGNRGNRNGQSINKMQTSFKIPSSPPVATALSSPHSSTSPPPHINPQHRITQLERNLSLLQQQHAQMLHDLHREIERLKNRNRELQFQLIMGGESEGLVSRLGSPEDSFSPSRESRGPAEISAVSVSPLQVEILDNEIKQLQSNLHEARSRNVYLSNLVEQQKKTLQELNSIDLTPRSPSPPAIPPEYLKKLEEAENLVQQLQQQQQVQKKQQEALVEQLKHQNEVQRQELSQVKSSLERHATLKFRGCNHPTASRLKMGVGGATHRSNSTSRIDTVHQDGVESRHTRSHEDVNRFPPLRSRPPQQKRTRSPLSLKSYSELPPVPGSSGSESSVSSRRAPGQGLPPPGAARPPGPPPPAPLPSLQPPGKTKSPARRWNRGSYARGGSVDRRHFRL